MKKTKYLIIGSGPAAAAAVDSIRKNDRKSSLTIITKENIAFYSRPLISYWLAGDLGSRENIQYRSGDFIKNNDITLLKNATATEFDFKKKNVRYREGKNKHSVQYEKLLIATGGEPFVPENLKNNPAVYTFTTIDDASNIDKAAKSAAEVAIIGGGFIGLKAAEALSKRGMTVSIIELASHVLPAILDEESSDIFQKSIISSGVKIYAKDSVKSYDGKKLSLKSGQIISADLAVAAIGVMPNINLFKSSRLKTFRGILVNDSMETNLKDVYAAGDVAEARESITGKKRPIPIWHLAYNQGSIAGSSMSGGKKRYTGGLVMNSVEVFGMPVISAGLTKVSSPKQRTLKKTDNSGQIYKKLIFENDRLIGFIMLGDIERAGIYTELIKSRADVSSLKDELIGDNFGFISVGEESWKKQITPLEI